MTKWYTNICCSCGHTGDAKIYREFAQLPAVLILHLKRCAFLNPISLSSNLLIWKICQMMEKTIWFTQRCQALNIPMSIKSEMWDLLLKLFLYISLESMISFLYVLESYKKHKFCPVSSWSLQHRLIGNKDTNIANHLHFLDYLSRYLLTGLQCRCKYIPVFWYIAEGHLGQRHFYIHIWIGSLGRLNILLYISHMFRFTQYQKLTHHIQFEQEISIPFHLNEEDVEVSFLKYQFVHSWIH